MSGDERGPFNVDDYTRDQQAAASDPASSAWVMANAGSGKTKVLSDRVIRLLLAGCDPSRILCLTFTTAAAGEMANRVFERLAEWTTLPEPKLKDELRTLTRRAPSQTDLLAARRLFARALETPGGLKIQTIHAFCEALLHAFPLEANVPGTFAVMDETAQETLVSGVTDRMLEDFYVKPGTEAAKAFSRISHAVSDDAVDRLFGEVIGARDALSVWLDAHGGVDGAIGATREAFGIPADTTQASVADEAVSSSLTTDEWTRLREVALTTGAAKMVALAENITAFLDADCPTQRMGALGACLLTQKGEPRAPSTLVSKAVEKELPDIRDKLIAETDRMLAVLDRLRTLRTIDRTRDGLIVGQELLVRFRAAKRVSGMLDYADLIAGAARLLASSKAREWVLYKLDAGLDHVLLDEAQDTSPLQWSVIERLTGDFFSGKSARETRRTMFAVGDEKQSIYSFQGAQPAQFSDMRRAFQKRAEGVEGGAFVNAKLDRSFRSTEDVLAAVDRVFAEPFAFTGLNEQAEKTIHSAARANKPGAVEVWPLVLPEGGEPPEDWTEVVDQKSSRHQAVILAERIADRIKLWLRSDERLCAVDRPIVAGDILVLVRSRDHFAATLTRLLKERDVAVAGTDRLALTDHIAVQDLLALGRVVSNTADDLSLAALMKSPLLGLGEDDLYTLARARLEPKPGHSLWEALQRAAEDGVEPRFVRAHDIIQGWLDRAGTVAPYEFYADILGGGGGRGKFYARLGLQAQDVLDAFLDQTLAHEQTGVPGLQAFVQQLETSPPIIKREMGKGAQGVRIMTVHGAKGLEAPVVFFVDKTSDYHQARNVARLIEWGDPDGPASNRGWVWIPSKDDHVARTEAVVGDLKQADADEHRRLLYVGMTRAEDRLIVCGYAGKEAETDEAIAKRAESWHGLVSSALQVDWQVADAKGNPAHSGADGDDPWKTWVWHRPGRTGKDTVTAQASSEPDDEPASLPAWVRHAMPKPSVLPRPLSPSGAQALVEEPPVPATAKARVSGGLDARQRGTLAHAMLQWLPGQPPEARTALALSYLAGAAPVLPDSDRSVLAEQVLAVLDTPDLARFFTPGISLAEVPIMGTVQLGGAARQVGGTIDRLVAEDDTVWALDFKTGAHVPDGPDDVAPVYVTQMALYRALLQGVYPGRVCRAALLYTAATEGPRLIEISAKQMDTALVTLSAAVEAAA